MSAKLKRELEAVIAADVSAKALAGPMNTNGLLAAIKASCETFPTDEFDVHVHFRNGLPMIVVWLRPHWLA